MKVKNWKTTLGGVIGVMVMAAGIFWPDKIDPETQVQLNLLVAESVTAVGGLIALITAILAKDPE